MGTRVFLPCPRARRGQAANGPLKYLASDAGTLESWGYGQDRHDRGGQRAQHEALPRPVGGPWLPDRGHAQRHRGPRPCPQASSRPDPHGHPTSRSFRSRSNQVAEGRSGAAHHSGRGGDRLCDEGRRGAHPGGRLRGLSLEADLGRQVHRDHPPFPGQRLRRLLMTARVLVVDDVPANVKLLEARLSAEYFDVVTAMSGSEALAICEKAECDIVLLDVMMPDMDGFEVCRRIKANRATHHIPVVMVTALDAPSDRVKGLDAGADDFLTKPVSDVALIARVRSLSRLKMMTDELRMRAVTSREIGIESPEREALAEAGRNGRILMVDDRPALSERIQNMLSGEHSVAMEMDPTEALFHAAEGSYDLLIVSLDLDSFDGLRLCS